MATWRELQELRDEDFWLLRPEAEACGPSLEQVNKQPKFPGPQTRQEVSEKNELVTLIVLGFTCVQGDGLARSSMGWHGLAGMLARHPRHACTKSTTLFNIYNCTL